MINSQPSPQPSLPSRELRLPDASLPSVVETKDAERVLHTFSSDKFREIPLMSALQSSFQLSKRSARPGKENLPGCYIVFRIRQIFKDSRVYSTIFQYFAPYHLDCTNGFQSCIFVGSLPEKLNEWNRFCGGPIGSSCYLITRICSSSG